MDALMTIGRRYCVLYRHDGKEQRSAWFSRRERAVAAKNIISARHGASVIYVD